MKKIIFALGMLILIVGAYFNGTMHAHTGEYTDWLDAKKERENLACAPCPEEPMMTFDQARDACMDRHNILWELKPYPHK